MTLAAEHLPDRAFPGKAADLLDRAAAIAASRNDTSFAGRLAHARIEKEAAIDNQDFEAAANYREQERRLLSEEKRWKAEWRNTPSQRIVSVTAKDIAQALTDSQA